MTRATPPTITPRDPCHNRGAGLPRLPRREEIERGATRWLKRGARTKADLRIVDVGHGPMVIKDFGSKPAWVRPIGRLQVSRECRAYRWVGPTPGLPRFIGRVDAHALAIELIEGAQPALRSSRPVDGAEAHAELRGIVERLHRAGLYHLDLRGRDNVLVGADGRLYVVDLAGAIWFRPGGWPRERLAGWFEMTDRAALLKWKSMLGAGPLTERERAFLRRYRFWRSLWIFNPKRTRRD